MTLKNNKFFNIKSFTCDCMMISTVSKIYNQIHDEMKNHKLIVKMPLREVLVSEKFRRPTTQEKNAHKIQIEQTVNKSLTEFKKNHANNKFTLKKIVDNDKRIDYMIELESSDSVETKSLDGTIQFKCPNCNKVLATWKH